MRSKRVVYMTDRNSKEAHGVEHEMSLTFDCLMKGYYFRLEAVS